MRASGRIPFLGLFLTAMLASAFALTAVPAIADDSDMYEIGTMSLDDYGEPGGGPAGKCCCLLYNKKDGKWTYSDATWSGFSDGLVVRLHELSPGYHEMAPFPIRDAAARSSQVESTGDNLGDDVDVFVWTGHSYMSVDPGGEDLGPGPAGEADYGAALHFALPHPNKPPPPHYICCYYRDNVNVNHKEVRLGADDCEVAVFLTCEFLRNRNYQPLQYEIRRMMYGTHIMLGYATSAYYLTYQHEYQYGRRLGENFMGIAPSQLPMKVIDAWHAASEWAQKTIIPEPVCARALYWDGDCENDYLLGNWQGWGMGGPPPPCLPGQEWQFNETTYWIYPDP